MSSNPNDSDETTGERTGTPGLTRIAHFEIFCRRYLSPEGEALCELPEFCRDRKLLRDLYRQMVLTRTFDEKAVALQRTGRLGTYASVLGQEAVGTGVANAMREEDILLPSFREHGAQMRRGVSVEELLQFWGGDERGSDFSGPRRDFPNCIPVATHFPHAAGAALALKLRDESGVADAIAGDGATSKGDFYEAINLAGAWQLPMLVVIVNNGWAISVPRTAQSHARTLAQKAISAGIQGEMVDGNDVLAVLDATRNCLDDIRSGKGPRLIEALTYRLGDHTTADDASRYRDDGVVSGHWKEEPISRLRDYMAGLGAWAKEDEQSLLAEARRQIEAGVERYLSLPAQPASALFDTLFEALPVSLAEQRNEVVDEEARSDA